MNPNMPPEERQGPMRNWGTGSKVVVHLTNNNGYAGGLVFSDATGVIIEERPDRQIFFPYSAIIRIEKRSAAG